MNSVGRGSSSRAKATRLGALAMAAVALGCAAIAAMMISRMLKARGYTGTEVQAVVIARTDLPSGLPIRANQLKVVDWPKATVPAGAFSTIEAVLKNPEATVPTAGILAGEAILSVRLSSDRSGTGVVRLLRENMRAVAVKVDDAIGQTGLVYPGATVDVIVTIRDPKSRGPASRIAVQNARVLTVGADSDVATRRKKTSSDTGAGRNTYLTLEVTPRDSEIIAMGRNEGRIDIALRSSTDTASVDTAGVTPDGFSADELSEDEPVQEIAEESHPAPPAKKKARAKKRQRGRRKAKKTAKSDTQQESTRDRPKQQIGGQRGGRKIRLVAK